MGDAIFARVYHTNHTLEEKYVPVSLSRRARRHLGNALIPLLLIAGVVVPQGRLAVTPTPATASSGSHAGAVIRDQTTLRPTTHRVTLVARPARLTLRQGQTVPVWAFNGTVPGPEIRVYQGDRVRVTLVNRLPVATTIHWHGLIAPNSNDGVAGVTQDAVRPGSSYVYEFVARAAGTYWYHPHQKSAEEVDKGLYGALIVLPRQRPSQPTRDRTLLLDEWPPAPPQMAMPGMGRPDATMAATPMSATTPAALRPYVADSGMEAYRTFTINGRAYPDTTPIQAPAGTDVRLRLVNAGYLTHVLHLHGTTYRLVALDGTDLAGPPPTGDLLPIAAGQRMDIVFRMPRGVWSLHDHSGLPGADEMRVLLGQGTRPGVSDREAMRAAAPPLLDLARYGRPVPAQFSRRSSFDRVFRLVIGQKAGGMGGMAGMGMDTVYTLNGQTFPRTSELRVRAGQRVELIFVNRSTVAHPMHLHGHRMQVLMLNGEPVRGSPLYQDTVMVLPGQTTTVAFIAANPGLWMLHCHELHHASSGLDTMLNYQGVPRRFSLGGPRGNEPE